MQVGIVSWGVGSKCGIEGMPGVYVDVTKFQTWIRDVSRKKGLINIDNNRY